MIDQEDGAQSDSSSTEPTKVYTQHNEVVREDYIIKIYRDQFLKDLSAYIKQLSAENKVKDFLLIANINQ